MKRNHEKMVTTVTLNPALDRCYTVDDIDLGTMHRLQDEKKVLTSPGGKGINVAVFLQRIGVETITMGFLGGHIGRMMESLIHEENITTNFVHIGEETRTNITLIDNIKNKFTAINQRGPKISQDELEIFIERYKKMLKISKIVVLSGSIPPGIPENIYATLINLAHKHKVIPILNCPGIGFEMGIEAGPYIAYPDTRGVPKLYAEEIHSLKGLFHAGDKILETNPKIELVILTKPAIHEIVALTKTGHYYVEIEDLKMSNLYGFGDAIIGGIVYGLVHDHNMLESLKIGIAAGVVKLESVKKYHADLKEIVQHVKRIKMHSILTKG